MTLTIRTPPAAEPVSLAEAKHHLRIGHDLEDAYVASLLAAARGAVEAHAGLALVTRAVRETLDAWRLEGPRAATLALGPVTAVQAVRVADASGALVEVSASAYQLDGAASPPRLLFFQSIPSPARLTRGVEIDYEAGFGAPADVPAALRQACLIVLAAFYEARSGEAPFPQAAASLLAPFRRPRL